MDKHQDQDRHGRIQDLYLEALEKDPTERIAYARKRAAGDTELFAELEKLLRIEENDARLDTPISPVLLTEMFETPERIGDYEITGLLGEGGMGIVYEARQRNPQRAVALKVLRFNGGAEALRRFEHETEVLSSLQHPGIASIYEAGVTAGSLGDRPFFSMERIEGERIDQFVEHRKLDEEQCVTLFLRVIEGVSYAHRKGVIHRDLKPANILVQEDGMPKILDFGVARAVNSESEETLLTRTGELVGTLAFMSPEQVAGDPNQIDTRVDVYALGVILYRLLSGANPIDLDGSTTLQALKRVAEENPKALRSAAPGVSADLATVVHKALDKAKERRYSTAEALAEDLQRFLDQKPILARTPSRAYVAKRFFQRNRAASLAAAAAVLALGIGATVSTTQYWKAERTNEQLALSQGELKMANSGLQESNASLQEAKELSDKNLRIATRRLEDLNDSIYIIQDVIALPSVYEDGAERTLLETLQSASVRVRGASEEPPIKRAWLSLSIGRAMLRLNEFEEAEELFDTARFAVSEAEYEQPLLDKQLDVFEAELADSVNDHEGAAALWEKIAKTEYGLSEKEDAYTRAEALARGAEIWVRLGRGESVLARFDEARALAELCGEEAEDLQLQINIGQSSALFRLKRYEDCKALVQEALPEARMLHGDSAPSVGILLDLLRSSHFVLDEFEEFRAAAEEGISISDSALGLDHPLTIERKRKLAIDLMGGRDRDRARELFNEVVETLRRIGPRASVDLADALNRRASLLTNMEEPDAAEEDLDQVLVLLEGVETAQAVATRVETKGLRARAKTLMGEYDQAEALLLEAIAEKQAHYGAESHPGMIVEYHRLAVVANQRGDHLLFCQRLIENARRNALLLSPDHPKIEGDFVQAGLALDRYVANSEHDTEVAEELRGIIEDRRL